MHLQYDVRKQRLYFVVFWCFMLGIVPLRSDMLQIQNLVPKNVIVINKTIKPHYLHSGLISSPQQSCVPSAVGARWWLKKQTDTHLRGPDKMV